MARHGAAVIGLANDDEIPMEPQRRLEVARKIVSVAGDHGIPPEDVVIDPLAMPVGRRAARGHAVPGDGAADPRRPGREHDLRRLATPRSGCPAGHTLGAAFLAVAESHGLTSAIMDARSRECVEAVRATDFLLGQDEWGARWIAAHRAKRRRRQQRVVGHWQPTPRRSSQAPAASG